MTTNFRYNPSQLDKGDREPHLKINNNFQRIYVAHQTLDATAIKAPTTGTGFAVMSGSEDVTGSKLGITSGLSAVDHVIASIDNGAVATNFWVTARVTPTDTSKVDLFVWMPTAVADTTPIAATTLVTVKWWVTGTGQVSGQV